MAAHTPTPFGDFGIQMAPNQQLLFDPQIFLDQLLGRRQRGPMPPPVQEPSHKRPRLSVIETCRGLPNQGQEPMMTAGVNSNGSADLNEPVEEKEQHADPTPPDHLGNSIINDLVAVSTNKNRLRMHILKRAKEFRAADLLQALQAGSYPWLGDALLLLDADTTMDLDTMVGLMLAMTAQGGVVAEHLGDFVQDLSDSTRSMLLGNY